MAAQPPSAKPGNPDAHRALYAGAGESGSVGPSAGLSLEGKKKRQIFHVLLTTFMARMKP